MDLGLGCMGMSGMYGPADRAEAVATIHAALDAGITFLDTGDFYGMGHNELLIGEALRQVPRENVRISVKFGGLRDPSGRFLGHDARPANVKTYLAYTLTRLGTDYVDVYRPSRPVHDVPVEEVVGAIGELIDAGYVREVGLSEAGSDTVRRAAAVRPIADVQLEYSLLSRSIEQGVLQTCRELGIAITAYGVLSRGILSGHWTPDRQLGRGDFRANAPRFQTGNVEQNLAHVERLRELADANGATVAQLAIGWVAAQGEDIVPLVGARTRSQLEEALGARALKLTPDLIGEIEERVPAGAAAGERYPAQQNAMLEVEIEAAGRS